MIFGFSGVGDFALSIFKGCNNTLIVKYIVPIVAFTDMVFTFLFESTGAIYFLILMYCLDFVTGVTKSIYYSLQYRRTQEIALKDKILTSKKFPRFLLTLLASLTILSLVKFMGIHSVVFIPLYSIFYPVFL